MLLSREIIPHVDIKFFRKVAKALFDVAGIVGIGIVAVKSWKRDRNLSI